MKKCIGCVVIVCVALCCVLAACVPQEPDGPVPFAAHSQSAQYATLDGEWQPVHDKAIIIIPGLMASSLYTTDETGAEKDIWGYHAINGTYMSILKDNGGLTAAARDALVGAMRTWLMCDRDSVPVTKVRVGNMNDGAYPDYSDNWADAWHGMYYIYNYLYCNGYAEEYDLVVWQYDWRQYLPGAAKELAAFIDLCGYDDVMFFTHSMGGLVVSNYLAMGQSYRDKVEMFVPFGAPFLGSMDTITNLFGSSTSESGNLLDMLVGNVMSAAMGLIDLQSLARNMASVIEMIPCDRYNQTDAVADGSSAVLLDGRPLTVAELVDYVSGQDWSKDSSGHTRMAFADLENYHNTLFVDGKHVSQLVPTEYVCGTGVDTVVSANIDSATGMVTELIKGDGDGTVPYYSAVAGTLRQGQTACNVHTEPGISHGPLANDPSMDKTAYADWWAMMDHIMARFAAGLAGNATQDL